MANAASGSPSLRRSRARVLAVLGLVALPLATPILIGIRTIGYDAALDNDPLYRRDASPPRPPTTTDVSSIATDLPRDRAVAAGLRHARLDSWNPLAGTGVPLWAEEGSPFFPLKLPFYLWPSRRMYDLTLLARLLVGAVGAYVLARLRGLDRGGALVAGATFELSGTLLAQLPFVSFGATALLPWAVAAGYRLARSPDRRAVGVTAVILGVAAVAGHPTTILLVFMAFATALLGLVVRRGARPLRTAACAAVAVVLAFAIAAPSLLPFFELFRSSLSYKNTNMSRLVNVIQIGVSRNTLPIALFTPGVFDGPSVIDAHAIAGAVGPLVLGLAIAGAGGGGLDLPLILVGLVGIVIGTAPGVPTHLLPGLRFILPPYAWSLPTLALTQSAGRGATLGGARRGAVLAALAVLALGPLSLALVRDPAATTAPQYATDLRNVFGDPARTLVVLTPLVVALVILSIVGLLRRPRRETPRIALVLVTTTALQTAVLGPIVWQPRSRVLDAPVSPGVAFLRARLAGEQSRFTGTPTAGFSMSSMLFGLPDLRCVAGLAVRRYVEFLDVSGPAGPFERMTTGRPVDFRSPLLDLAATRLVVRSFGPFAPEPPPLPTVYQDANVAIHERQSALPRARVVHRIEAVPDEPTARARLAARSQLPLDAHVAIVEPDASGRHPEGIVEGPQLEPVRIVETDEPGRVVLETRLFAAGLVVLADAYYPGWTARVDGQPVPIYPTDLLFRGVLVQRGSHRIEFVYVPTYLYPAIAIGTLALLVALAAWRWPARRVARA